jgi:excisionase family DNA binding protein
MIDSDQLATLLGVKKYTIEQWARTNRIPGFKVGRWWKFDESEVTKALKLSGNDLSRAIGRVSK